MREKRGCRLIDFFSPPSLPASIQLDSDEPLFLLNSTWCIRTVDGGADSRCFLGVCARLALLLFLIESSSGVCFFSLVRDRDVFFVASRQEVESCLILSCFSIFSRQIAARILSCPVLSYPGVACAGPRSIFLVLCFIDSSNVVRFVYPE